MYIEKVEGRVERKGITSISFRISGRGKCFSLFSFTHTIKSEAIRLFLLLKGLIHVFSLVCFISVVYIFSAI